MPMLNLRLAAPALLVDLNRLEGLSGVRSGPGGLEIRALTRQRELEVDPEARAGWPVLARSLRHVGHVPTRNRGTVGGSLAHADPAAELPLVLVALDGLIEVTGLESVAEVRASDFFTGFFSTLLRPGELVTSCRVPPLGEGTGTGFAEVAPRFGDFALAAAAAVVRLDSSGRVTAARLALGALAPTPVVLRAVEDELVGRAAVDDDALRAVAELVRQSPELEPPASLHASAAYRRHLAGVVARRALAEAAREARAHSSGLAEGGEP